MVQGKVYDVYVKIHEWQDCSVTNARNLEVHPRNFYEICANKVKNAELWPILKVYPDLHNDFQTRHALIPDDVMPFFTGDKIKEKLSTPLRCNYNSICIAISHHGSVCNGAVMQIQDRSVGHCVLK